MVWLGYLYAFLGFIMLILWQLFPNVFIWGYLIFLIIYTYFAIGLFIMPSFFPEPEQKRRILNILSNDEYSFFKRNYAYFIYPLAILQWYSASWILFFTVPFFGAIFLLREMYLHSIFAFFSMIVLYINISYLDYPKTVFTLLRKGRTYPWIINWADKYQRIKSFLEKEYDKTLEEATKVYPDQKEGADNNTIHLKVLCIDPYQGNLESLKEILKIKKYIMVDTLHTGDINEAILKLERNEYDLIFYQLYPYGFKLLSYIKTHNPNTKVVVYAAYASDEIFNEALKLGALEYLRMPWLMDEIYALVEKAANELGKDLS